MDSGADSYRKYLGGDDSGLVEIVRDYREGLILYFGSFVSGFSAAEELAEDTFVKLGIRRPHFAGRSSFRTWLYAIGRNIAIDWLRKQAKSGELPLDDCAELADEGSVEASYLQEERKRVLHAAMKKLKPEYRQVLWLVYFEGFSCAETGKILRKRTHNVETLLSRARQALKNELIREGYQNEDL